MPRAGLILTALLLATPSCVLAQGVGPATQHQTALRNFNRIDIDGDGAITARDAAQARRMAEELHQVLDRDGDGNIWRDEFIVSASRARWWHTLDADGDGMLTVVELRRRLSPRTIEALDLNGDGRVTLRELRYER